MAHPDVTVMEYCAKRMYSLQHSVLTAHDATGGVRAIGIFIPKVSSELAYNLNTKRYSVNIVWGRPPSDFWGCESATHLAKMLTGMPLGAVETRSTPYPTPPEATSDLSSEVVLEVLTRYLPTSDVYKTLHPIKTRLIGAEAHTPHASECTEQARELHITSDGYTRIDVDGHYRILRQAHKDQEKAVADLTRERDELRYDLTTKVMPLSDQVLKHFAAIACLPGGSAPSS